MSMAGDCRPSPIVFVQQVRDASFAGRSAPRHSQTHKARERGALAAWGWIRSNSRDSRTNRSPRLLAKEAPGFGTRITRIGSESNRVAYDLCRAGREPLSEFFFWKQLRSRRGVIFPHGAVSGIRACQWCQPCGRRRVSERFDRSSTQPTPLALLQEQPYRLL